MRKQIISVAAALLLSIVVAGQCGAQQVGAIDVDIPFAFQAGARTMPAGEYRIQRLSAEMERDPANPAARRKKLDDGDEPAGGVKGQIGACAVGFQPLWKRIFSCGDLGGRDARAAFAQVRS